MAGQTSDAFGRVLACVGSVSNRIGGAVPMSASGRCAWTGCSQQQRQASYGSTAVKEEEMTGRRSAA